LDIITTFTNQYPHGKMKQIFIIMTFIDNFTEEIIYRSGCKHLDNGEFRKSIRNFKRLLDTFPKQQESSAHYHLAEAHFYLYEYEEAKTIIKQGLEKFPEDTDLEYIKSAILTYQGEYREAITLVEKLRKKEPKDDHILAIYCEAQAKYHGLVFNDYDKALHYLQKLQTETKKEGIKKKCSIFIDALILDKEFEKSIQKAETFKQLHNSLENLRERAENISNALPQNYKYKDVFPEVISYIQDSLKGNRIDKNQLLKYIQEDKDKRLHDQQKFGEAIIKFNDYARDLHSEYPKEFPKEKQEFALNILKKNSELSLLTQHLKTLQTTPQPEAKKEILFSETEVQLSNGQTIANGYG